MRVRPNQQSTESRPRGYTELRRPHRLAREPQAAPAADLSDERRLREAGGPHDRATYSCVCGYVFEADVSTSVACPHCGSSQAW
jgi:rubrerythrin